jgi:hypothetical protein
VPTPTTPNWINLTGAEGKLITIQLVFNSQSPHNYTIQNFRIRGNKLSAGIAPAISGQPTSCTDNFSAVTVTHTDGTINWICNVPGNQEFWYNRAWRVSDGCDNFVIHNQRITEGAPPILGTPRDTTIDFCHSGAVSLRGPSLSDVCDATPTISWAFTLNGAPLSGSGSNNPTIAFPPSVLGGDTTYTVTWTLVDAAGFSVSANQHVTVKPQMHISLSPITVNFCTGESASFTISVAGGTGSYLTLVPGVAMGGGVSLTPNGTWSSSGNHSTGTYTTSNLTVLTPGTSDVITVNYTDGTFNGVVGGCSTGDQTFSSGNGFTVHQKISTNSLGRN